MDYNFKDLDVMMKFIAKNPLKYVQPKIVDTNCPICKNIIKLELPTDKETVFCQNCNKDVPIELDITVK